jgi:ribonuclease E
VQGDDNGRPPRDGELRRRRRGRRGGRRNRRDREGNGEQLGTGEQHGNQDSGVRQPYSMDTDIADATPVPRIEPAEVGQELGRFEEAPLVRPSAPIAQPVSPIEPEQPKRRSTVREPAPTFTSGQGFAPTPQPDPIPSRASEAPAPAAEPSSNDAKPRKTGWWAKRMFGDNG